MSSSYQQQFLDFLNQWWPAAILLLLVYFAMNFIRNSSGKVAIDSTHLTLHEIKTSLACTEQQAKKLLAIYEGDGQKAIHEIKTGKAVLPGEEVSDLAIFGGDLDDFRFDEKKLSLVTRDGRTLAVASAQELMLLLGVVDPSQRPDQQGNARADRGKCYAQLFVQVSGGWHRFLLQASRFNYMRLGEKKENSAIRNFRLVLAELQSGLPHLKVGPEHSAFQSELKAPLYKTLADFEAFSTQQLRNWKGLA